MDEDIMSTPPFRNRLAASQDIPLILCRSFEALNYQHCGYLRQFKFNASDRFKRSTLAERAKNWFNVSVYSHTDWLMAHDNCLSHPNADAWHSQPSKEILERFVHNHPLTTRSEERRVGE